MLLIISSSLGALSLYLLNTELNTILEGILLSLTIGMILYIALFELFIEVKKNLNQKETKIGLFLGFLFSLLLFFM